MLRCWCQRVASKVNSAEPWAILAGAMTVVAIIACVVAFVKPGPVMEKEVVRSLSSTSVIGTLPVQIVEQTEGDTVPGMLCSANVCVSQTVTSKCVGYFAFGDSFTSVQLPADICGKAVALKAEIAAAQAHETLGSIEEGLKAAQMDPPAAATFKSIQVDPTPPTPFWNEGLGAK